jgi:hypothetical protein
VAEIDEDARIIVERNVAQDLGELAGSELARSTRAGDHLGQALLAEWIHGDRINGHRAEANVARQG